MKQNISQKDKLMKLFESVAGIDTTKFKGYVDTKPVDENKPAIAEPDVKPITKPDIKPQTKPNPFAPSIEPDTRPKGEMKEEETPISTLANQLSDEIAKKYNQAKGQRQ